MRRVMHRSRARTRVRQGVKRDPTFFACFTSPAPAAYGKIPHEFFLMHRKPMPGGGVETVSGAVFTTCDQFGWDSRAEAGWSDADWKKFYARKQEAMRHVESVLRRTKSPSEFNVRSN